METQKEFDFLTEQHRPHDLHRAVAAGTFERIAATNLKNEIAPQGAHESGAALGWWLDEQELRLMIRLRQGYDGQVDDC